MISFSQQLAITIFCCEVSLPLITWKKTKSVYPHKHNAKNQQRISHTASSSPCQTNSEESTADSLMSCTSGTHLLPSHLTMWPGHQQTHTCSHYRRGASKLSPPLQQEQDPICEPAQWSLKSSATGPCL